MRSCVLILLAAAWLGSAAADDGRRAFSVAGTFAPANLRTADQAAFTRAVAWHVPVSEVAALFDLVLGDYDWSAEGLSVHVWVDRKDVARVAAFSMAWTYVYRQHATTVFASTQGPATMKLRPDYAPWQANLDDTALLAQIRRAWPERDVESKLQAMRARYQRVTDRMMAPGRARGPFGGGDT